MFRESLVFALAAVLSACAHVATTTDLTAVVRQKASFELNCTAPELTVTQLTGGQAMSSGFAATNQKSFGTNQKSFGVEGCGRRVSYYAWCTNMMGSQSCDAMQSSQVAGAAVGGGFKAE